MSKVVITVTLPKGCSHRTIAWVQNWLDNAVVPLVRDFNEHYMGLDDRHIEIDYEWLGESGREERE